MLFPSAVVLKAQKSLRRPMAQAGGLVRGESGALEEAGEVFLCDGVGIVGAGKDLARRNLVYEVPERGRIVDIAVIEE